MNLTSAEISQQPRIQPIDPDDQRWIGSPSLTNVIMSTGGGSVTAEVWAGHSDICWRRLWVLDDGGVCAWPSHAYDNTGTVLVPVDETQQIGLGTSNTKDA